MKTLPFLLVIGLASVINTHSAVTSLINYQGKLKKHGTNENGQVNIIFKIFTGETNNECVFEEAQQVMVIDGLYSTLIGTSPTLGNIEDAAKLEDAHLEVSINGSKLTPREKFTPPPFAKKSTERWINYRFSDPYQPYQIMPYGCFEGVTESFPAATFHVLAEKVSLISLRINLSGPAAWAPEIDYFDQSPEFHIQAVAAGGPLGTRALGPPLTFAITNEYRGTGPEHGWLTIPISTNTLEVGEYLQVNFRSDFNTTNQTTGSCAAWFRFLLDAQVK
jgi:hypothetical protein